MSTVSATARPSTTAPAPGWYGLQAKIAPYLFVAPFIILFATFGIYPLIRSILLMFYWTDGPKDHIWIGAANFRYMFHDPDFWKSVENTGTYALWSVFLQLPIALGLAILLNQRWLKGRGFFRLAFFSPNLLGQVFVGVLFTMMFTAHYGLVNKGLASIVPQIVPVDTKWLNDPAWVMPAIVITSLWLYCGFNMIYFLAALQAVDQDLYEAATIDGANSWQQFWNVTLPSIKPVAVFVLVTSTIGSFQLFELPYILLSNGGGPNNSGLTVVMYLYQSGLSAGNLGYASAVGWTLALAVLVISILQVRLTGAWKGTGA